MNAANTIGKNSVFSGAAYPLRVMRCPSHAPSYVQHAHEFHELVVIVDGSGKHKVEDKLYPIGTGDVFVILGDMRHCYPEADNLSLINLLYDPQRLAFPLADVGGLPGYHALFELEPMLRRQGKFQNRLRLTVDQLAQTLRLIAEMEEELHSTNEGRYFLGIAHLMRLIGYLSRCYSQLDLGEVRPVQQISNLLGYMEKNYAKPLTVKDLMGIAHMSQTTLMRVFNQLMGRSPIEHLIQLRVDKARQLLRRTEMSVTEIAQSVGFCDGNYLARQFRRIVRVSPREYRERRTGR